VRECSDEKDGTGEKDGAGGKDAGRNSVGEKETAR
jgi:hypothetical protein